MTNTPSPTLGDVQRKVRELAARIGALDHELPTFGRSEDGARPHIEVDHSGMHYVVVERGQELSRDTTRDLDELLEHVFKDVTFQMACRYELEHRVPGKDFRRLMFARQVELLASLSAAWAKREETAHANILVHHPFDDSL